MTGRNAPPADVRRSLLHEREQAAARAEALAEDIGAIVAASDLVAADDEHDPEGPTIAFERAQAQAMLGRTQDHLAALDLALERLEQGTYGVCERCGREIDPDRLEARPAATTCIGCAAAPRP